MDKLFFGWEPSKDWEGCCVCGERTRTMIRDKTVRPEKLYCSNHWEGG